MNAVQAKPEGGLLQISSCKSADCIEVEILDTGIGIPQEKTKKYNSIIDVESEVGKGTASTVKLLMNISGEL